MIRSSMLMNVPNFMHTCPWPWQSPRPSSQIKFCLRLVRQSGGARQGVCASVCATLASSRTSVRRYIEAAAACRSKTRAHTVDASSKLRNQRPAKQFNQRWLSNSFLRPHQTNRSFICEVAVRPAVKKPDQSIATAVYFLRGEIGEPHRKTFYSTLRL